MAWGVLISTIILAFTFQGYFVPGFRAVYRDLLFVAYILIFLVAVVSGMMLTEISTAVLSNFVSLALAGFLEYVVLTLPSTLGIAGLGVLADAGVPPLGDLAITIIFSTLFPVPTLVGFAGSVVGAALGEKVLV